ncbi:MAG: exodeoxyribonuclease VII small subunit [Paludibacteraceae bacterium]|nr:exodeoxyribonuclease VII small subunit [Paludibacteraceae bacterium]
MNKNTKINDYRSAVEELESIVARVKSGEMPVEQLKEMLERASELSDYCRKILYGVDESLKALK